MHAYKVMSIISSNILSTHHQVLIAAFIGKPLGLYFLSLCLSTFDQISR